MDLFWVIYFADISTGLKFVILGLSIPASGVFFFNTMEVCSNLNRGFCGTDEQQEQQRAKMKSLFKKLCRLLTASIFVGFLGILIPSPQAIYMMAGVEQAERIAERPETKEIGGKILRLLNQKLDDVLDEGPQSQGKTKPEIK